MIETIPNLARSVDRRDPPVRTLDQVTAPPPLIVEPNGGVRIGPPTWMPWNRLVVELLPKRPGSRQQPVRIKGVRYPSYWHAGRALGVSPATVRRAGMEK